MGALSLMLLLAVPVKLAVPGLVTVNVDQKLADLMMDSFVVGARSDDLEVVTARDISTVLGLERQRQLLGCDSSGSNCVAELAGAVGADAVLSGTIARSDVSLTLVLRAIRAQDARELASVTVRARSQDELQDWIDSHARGFGQQLVARFRGESDPGRGPAWPKWTALIGGVVVGGSGGALRGFAETKADALRGATRAAPVNVEATASDGRIFEATGNVMVGVGAAALAAGAVLFAVQPSTPLALVPVPGGAGLVVQGRF